MVTIKRVAKKPVKKAPKTIASSGIKKTVKKKVTKAVIKKSPVKAVKSKILSKNAPKKDSLAEILESRAAQNIFNSLKDEGYLKNIYSKEWFDKQDPDGGFSPESFTHISSEYKKSLNHLLILTIDEYNKDNLKKLSKIFPFLKKHLDGVFHKPDFLLINLNIKKMICVGLGRKNKVFLFDAETEQIVSQDVFDPENKYMSRFIKHDIYEAVPDFLEAINRLSYSYFEIDHLPSNSEQVSIALDEKPGTDGLYSLEYTDEHFTKDELIDIDRQYSEYENQINEALKVISQFSPKDELNTGDY
jgi:hypothetical protein